MSGIGHCMQNLYCERNRFLRWFRRAGTPRVQHTGLSTMLLRNFPAGSLSLIVRRCVSTVHRDIESLISMVRRRIGEERNLNVFVGVGQYYNYEGHTRIVLLRLGDNWTPQRDIPPEQIADIATDRFSIRDVATTLQSLGICRSVLTGELDCIQDGDWKFGFVTGSRFSIFSRSGSVLQTKSYFTGPKFQLKQEGHEVKCSPDDIKSVRIEISDEPWEYRQLLMELQSGQQLTVLESSDEQVLDEAHVDPPLAKLMMSTEWLVKAGAHICVASSRLGQVSRKPLLLLPRILTEEGNMWVQMRNEAWARGVTLQVPVED